jgi:hypothetical protein
MREHMRTGNPREFLLPTDSVWSLTRLTIPAACQDVKKT